MDMMPDMELNNFVEEQVAHGKRRNARRDLDQYMEKKRLRSSLTFFEVDDNLLNNPDNFRKD